LNAMGGAVGSAMESAEGSVEIRSIRSERS